MKDLVLGNITIDLFIDTGFWSIIPSININAHSKELELEWLCFGAYIGRSCI